MNALREPDPASILTRARWEEDMLQNLCSLSKRLGKWLPPWVVAAMIVNASPPAESAPPAQEVFTATTAITLPSGQTITRFDISFVDPSLNLYLLADRTNRAVDVVDTTSNKVLIQLLSNLCPTAATPCPFVGFTGNNDTSGPNGVLTIGHEVWAGDGNSTIKVIDLLTHVTTHVINTGGKNRADELCFDPRDQLVLMANDAESPFPFVTLISTETYTVLKTIVMNGTSGTPKATNGIEQCQWSPSTGMFYLNIPEVNGPGDDTQPGAVLVISPETMTIVDTFTIPLGVCAGPQGMALGPENQILLGCNNPNHTVPSTVASTSAAAPSFTCSRTRTAATKSGSTRVTDITS
jgi:hypothetical protein